MDRKIFVDDEMKHVIVLVDNDGKKEKKLLTMHCALGTNDCYHRDSVRRARNEGLNILDIQGGGRIAVNRSTKLIKVYDSSGSYGPFNTGDATELVTKAMQEEGFEDYKLVVR